MQSISTEQPFTEYPVRQVEFAAIPKWLRQGAEDIKANPWSSLLYGFIFALVGMGMSLLSANNPGFFMTTAAGFMLWGPFLALGLYDLSLRRENGDPVNFLKSTLALKRNPVNLILYSVMLGVLVLLWLRMSSIVLDIFLQDTAVAEQHSYIGFMAALLGSKMGWLFTLSFMSVGLLFAVVSFMTGVATVPMLLERKVSLVTALNTSIRAIIANWKVMLAWAATIAVIISAGLLPFSLGLIIAMPLISYASWHAYRDMVEAV